MLTINNEWEKPFFSMIGTCLNVIVALLLFRRIIVYHCSVQYISSIQSSPYVDFDPWSATVANQVVGVYFSWVEETWYTLLTQGATMATTAIIIINRRNPPPAFPLYSKDVASISTCFFSCFDHSLQSWRVST